MKRKRFTEEQIIAVLKEHEAGAKTADLCRKHGISDATFYNWKAKFGGLDVSVAKRLKALEGENAKPKKLLAEADARQRGAEGYAQKMYGPPRRCKVFRSAAGSSLRKCIRPLASELLLQPGHDEMRAHRSQQMVRAQGARFFDRAYDAPINCSDISPWTSQFNERDAQA